MTSARGLRIGMKHMHCSGPLFCPEEVAGMNALAKVLEGAGFGTFLPHRDGVERYVLSFFQYPFQQRFPWVAREDRSRDIRTGCLSDRGKV